MFHILNLITMILYSKLEARFAFGPAESAIVPRAVPVGTSTPRFLYTSLKILEKIFTYLLKACMQSCSVNVIYLFIETLPHKASSSSVYVAMPCL